MSQDDFIIANQGFPAFRSDLNSNLQALASTSSGATAPSTTYANQLWYDTANDILKIRNEANSAWINVITLDQTNNKNSSITVPTIDSGTSTALTLKSGTTTAMTIDTSQNVGIGTSSPAYKLEVKGASGAQGYLSIHDGTGDTTVSGNNAASLLFQTRDTSIRTIAEIDAVNTTTNGTGGAMVFQTRISDTLAERMRIDSSGNVGIGTTTNYQMNNTSSTPKQMIAMGNNTGLNILRYNGFGTGGAFINLGASGGASLGTYSGAVANSGLGSVNFGGDNGTNYNGNGAQIYAAASETWTTSTNAGYLVFATTPSGSVGPAERMRIDSSGNLLVGTTASNARLSVDGAGNTSSGYTVYVRNSTPNDLLYLRNDGFFSTGNAGSSPYNATTATAANVVVASNGQLQRSTSSLKYKTDVKDATHGLAEVMQLRPVTYKGKTDGDKVFGGLIAEEVDAVGLTEFVQYAEDGSPDALAYGNMVSLLVAAIKELKAELDALKGTK